MTTESNVVRIVNLDDSFTEEKLKKFILINCQLRGTVKNVYVKRDNKINIFYGYVVFEYGYDALKTTEILNGHTFISNELEVELIGPYLKYRKYGIDGEIKKPFTVREYLDRLRTRIHSTNAQHNVGPGSVQVNRAINESGINHNILQARINQRVATSVDSGKAGGLKYVPPNMPEGAVKRTNGFSMARQDVLVTGSSSNTRGSKYVYAPTYNRNKAMYHNRLVAGGSGISSGFKYIPPHMPNKATNGASKVSPAVNTVDQSNYSDEFDLIDFYD